MTNLAGKERYSIPFFFGVDYDTTVSVLDNQISKDKPACKGPFKAGEVSYCLQIMSHITMLTEMNHSGFMRNYREHMWVMLGSSVLVPHFLFLLLFERRKCLVPCFLLLFFFLNDVIKLALSIVSAWRKKTKLQISFNVIPYRQLYIYLPRSSWKFP